MMNRILLTVFLSLLTIGVYSQPTSVFVTPHPDDWQLFMNPNAYHAVSDSNQHVIFLHLTSGDAGHGMEYNDFTRAREEGSKRALRFLLKAAFPRENFDQTITDTVEIINDFKIETFSYHNIKAYFLRLPDGNYDGSGYERHNQESIKKIVSGEKLTINTIDGINTYTLDDLISTINRIIPTPNELNPLSVHIAETDSEINPDDHSDHISTAELVKLVLTEKKPYRLFEYIEYHSNSMPMNVFPDEYQVSVATWGATISGVSDFGHYSTWDETHNSWLGRQYYSETLIELQDN